VGAGALAAAAVAVAAVSGCASQKLNTQTATVSTASAAAAVVAVQNSTCPATVPQTLASNVSGLSTQLEPLQATKVLLCVYPSHLNDSSGSSSSDSSSPGSGGSASPPAPKAVTLTDSMVISSLRNALNALATPPTSRVNCPNDTGSAVLGIFVNGQQATEILMTTSGCPTATNGQKTGWVGASDFVAVLTAALKGN
jgi:hypothetical protein